MSYDEEGFIKPLVDYSICSNCGLCVTKCPAIHPTYINWETPKCYAAYADEEERTDSTSGGIFRLLAEYIIENGGVVFGAAYTDDFCVEHIAIKRKEDLHTICHTKYVQSDTNSSFSAVKKLLEKGTLVLFSGCPCQIAGLKAVLGKNYELLYTVDILCMQVPPAPLFSRYLKETYGDISNLIDVKFRDKSEGWEAKNLTVTTKKKVDSIDDYPLGWLTESKTEYYESKVVYHRNVRYDAYLKIFYNKLTMNSVCANCQFATFPRQGDISLGDFWGIYKHDQEFDNQGTNLVLVNNQHGDELYSYILGKTKKNKLEPLDLIGKNRAQGTLQPYVNRSRIFELIKSKSISETVEQCENSKYDIGLVGGWTTPNYGGSLTYYALFNVLQDMGFSVILITHPRLSRISWDVVIKNMKFDIFPYPSYSYMEPSQSIVEMKKYNQICESFVVGSDQLFNYKMYSDMDGFVNLRWVNDNKRKIAYSASFGLDEYNGPEYARAELQYFLKKFDFFSVRENSGVDLVRKNFGIDAEWVLDPVFLCDEKHYIELISDCKDITPSSPYIFSYMLDIDASRENILKSFSNVLDLPVVAIDDALEGNSSNKKWTINTIHGANNNFYLACIKNANYVITDSFHGMCFCIIFKKPFSVIMNSKRGSTRMESLVKLFGLEQRVIFEKSNEKDISWQIKNRIDYYPIQEIMEKERKRCLGWLENAIKADIGPKALSEYDILDNRLDSCIRQMMEMDRKSKEEFGNIASTGNVLRNKKNNLFHSGIRSLRERGIIGTAKRVYSRLTTGH